MTEHQWSALVRLMSDELAQCANREQLLVFARRWLYGHRLLIVHDRAILAVIAAALARFEAGTSASIRSEVPPEPLEQWCRMIVQPHATGLTHQSWLWAAPARHSKRQISGVLGRDLDSTAEAALVAMLALHAAKCGASKPIDC